MLQANGSYPRLDSCKVSEEQPKLNLWDVMFCQSQLLLIRGVAVHSEQRA